MAASSVTAACPADILCSTLNAIPTGCTEYCEAGGCKMAQTLLTYGCYNSQNVATQVCKCTP